eukprot:443514-Alexandrium_andersonii.AAC.1
MPRWGSTRAGWLHVVKCPRPLKAAPGCTRRCLRLLSCRALRIQAPSSVDSLPRVVSSVGPRCARGLSRQDAPVRLAVPTVGARRQSTCRRSDSGRAPSCFSPVVCGGLVAR